MSVAHSRRQRRQGCRGCRCRSGRPSTMFRGVLTLSLAHDSSARLDCFTLAVPCSWTLLTPPCPRHTLVRHERKEDDCYYGPRDGTQLLCAEGNRFVLVGTLTVHRRGKEPALLRNRKYRGLTLFYVHRIPPPSPSLQVAPMRPVSATTPSTSSHRFPRPLSTRHAAAPPRATKSSPL